MNYTYTARRGLGCILFTLISCGRGQTIAEKGPENTSSQPQVCADLAFPLEGLSHPDSLARRCEIVRLAVGAIADGRAEPEFAPSDTARISSAMVTYFAFRDTSGKTVDPYWSVDFVIEDLSYRASVHIYPSTGRVTVGRTHN